MLDREKLKSEVLLGEKLTVEKALLKANVRLASFENICRNRAQPSGVGEKQPDPGSVNSETGITKTTGQ
jgi:hypothetical protein